MRHVADAECDGIGVEMRVRKRKPLGVTAHPFDRTLALCFSAAPALAQHRGVDVADRDRGLTPAGACHARYAECDVARAARDVQYAPAGLRIEPFDHRILPDAVNAPRHDVVHQIVTCRDRGKDLAHKAFLFGLRHIAETEAGGFAVVHAPSIARPWPNELDKP